MTDPIQVQRDDALDDRELLRSCFVEGCGLPRHSKAYCDTHYYRWRRYGDPLGGRPTLAERFWAKVNKTETCWLWTAYINAAGYAVYWNGSNNTGVHRIAYELTCGPIPQGLTIDHLCRVRHCVNPDHLEAVTNRVNVLRSEAVSAKFARATHCVKGHPFAGGNLMVRPQGGRRCLICHNETSRRTAKRRRDAWKSIGI